MLRGLGFFACVVALLVQIGAHWAILQTIAWSNMWISYTQEMDAGEALIRTLDGKSPCSMCTQISQEKAEEQRDSPALPRLNFDGLKAWCTTTRVLPKRWQSGVEIRWPSQVYLYPGFLGFPPEERPPQA
jgi:hypothetical protein